LLTLAVSFARVGARTGIFTYSIVDWRRSLAGWRPYRRQGLEGEGDLFGLVIGLVATVTASR